VKTETAKAESVGKEAHHPRPHLQGKSQLERARRARRKAIRLAKGNLLKGNKKERKKRRSQRKSLRLHRLTATRPPGKSLQRR